MVQLLNGKDVTDALNEEMKKAVSQLKGAGIFPTLGIVRIGERGDDIAYEKGATKRAETIGVAVKKYLFSETITQETLLREIEEINRDQTIHGVLLFKPLPGHIDEHMVCNALVPSKDIDGITAGSMAGVYAGLDIGYPPCTPQACMAILDYYGIDVKGKKVAVIGRSLVVGKPVAMMLMKKDATVTICHTKTVDTAAICRDAEILIVAAGRAKGIGRDCFNEDQVIIDVGINVDNDGNLCGDVDFADAIKVVRAITPVPGGVGTVTTSLLIKHVIDAAKRSSNG